MRLTKPGNQQSGTGRTRIGAALLALTLILTQVGLVHTPVLAEDAIVVPMGTLTDFSALATTAIGNTAASGTTFSHRIGVSPAGAITEISAADVCLAIDCAPPEHGIHLNDAIAQKAQADFNVAYDYVVAQAPTDILADLGGQTLTPGVYGAPPAAATALTMTTPLILDAEGDVNGVFIIRTAGALTTTAANGNVELINGAQACNVFFLAGGAVDLGAGTNFSGIILSKGAISVGALTTVNGRAFTGAGAMGVNGNPFSEPSCAGITVNPTDGLETTEDGGQATFTVVLDSEPSSDVTIGVSSDDPTEGTVDTSELTFTTSNWNEAQTVTVTGVDDDVADGDIEYTIVVAEASGGDYEWIGPTDVSVTNLDNDTAGVTVTPTSGLVTTEAGGMATFTVVLKSQPTANVKIGVSSSDTTEGTVSPAQLTFTASNWATAQTVTVTGVDDAVADGHIAYTVVLGEASGGNYEGIDAANVSVTNLDNDTVGITVTPTEGLVTTETGGSDTFVVVLGSEPLAPVKVGVTSSDISEGTVSPTLLTFTASDWSRAQTVTVTGVNDNLDDGNVDYTVILGVVATGGAYALVNPSNVSVTNLAGPVGGCGTDFTDVDGSNIFEDPICWLADQGITRGCNPPANTRFCPDAPVTRAQMAAFLVRAFGYTDNGGGNLYTDTIGTIFEADIDRLGTAGVTKGCNPPQNTLFCPDDNVTRGQMAAFLVRAFGYTDNGGGNLYTDTAGSTFAADIDRLGTAGVTLGCNPPDNTRFCPDALVTRGQMAAFLMRAFAG